MPVPLFAGSCTQRAFLLATILFAGLAPDITPPGCKAILLLATLILIAVFSTIVGAALSVTSIKEGITTALVAFKFPPQRAPNKAAFARGARAGITHLIVTALCLAIKTHPIVSTASWLAAIVYGTSVAKTPTIVVLKSCAIALWALIELNPGPIVTPALRVALREAAILFATDTIYTLVTIVFVSSH
jgi:hypothetical protein